MDIHAHGAGRYRDHEPGYGRIDRDPDHPFCRRRKRYPLGASVWRHDLGDLLRLLFHPAVSRPERLIGLNERNPEPELDWESLWAPYDAPTYQTVLAELSPNDIVLDIGAGDLRLAREMASICKKVYAIEIQPDLIRSGLNSIPSNLIVLQGDARLLIFPGGITTGVLLMRHCTHFYLYAKKLKAAGCRRLITNARWRMGVEIVNLQAARQPFQQIPIGWYACLCGSTGFVTGDPGLLNPHVEAVVHEAVDCPQCRDVFRRIVL